MNKKQVAALLKVISKDETRPEALRCAYIDKYNDKVVMVATDGYKLAAIYLTEDHEHLVGRLVRREAIEKWYKLSTGKSRLIDDIEQVSNEDYAASGSYAQNYPKWQTVLPVTEPDGQKVMRFNAEFFKLIQELDGADDLVVTLYGDLAPMEVKTERGFYLVMPMKNV